MNSIFNMLDFKCLRNTPMFGGRCGHGAQQTGLSHLHGCGRYLLYSEGTVVEEITQDGQKETQDKVLESLNI